MKSKEELTNRSMELMLGNPGEKLITLNDFIGGLESLKRYYARVVDEVYEDATSEELSRDEVYTEGYLRALEHCLERAKRVCIVDNKEELIKLNNFLEQYLIVKQLEELNAKEKESKS